MKFTYKPKSNLEKFGNKVYSALVENFSQTFFVGGMVRDLLLKKKITDIDIATSATPEQIIVALNKLGVEHNDSHKKFGNIVARQGSNEVEVTTLRKDLKSVNRYPRVRFVSNPKADSIRRDFSINSLYLKPKLNIVLDFNRGLADIKKQTIRFIGNPKQRIVDDPLRIIRALRFALVLNFKLEAKTKNAIKNNFFLLNNLTKTKIQKEIAKVRDAGKRKTLKQFIDKPKMLDKYFK